jgi:hypothetical protein
LIQHHFNLCPASWIIIIHHHHHHHHLWRNPSWSSVIVRKEKPSSMWGTLNHKFFYSPHPLTFWHVHPPCTHHHVQLAFSYRVEPLAGFILADSAGFQALLNGGIGCQLGQFNHFLPTYASLQPTYPPTHLPMLVYNLPTHLPTYLPMPVFRLTYASLRATYGPFMLWNV